MLFPGGEGEEGGDESRDVVRVCEGYFGGAVARESGGVVGDVEHEGEDGYVGGEVGDDVFHEEPGGDGGPF